MPVSHHELLTACADGDFNKNNRAAILELCIDEGAALSDLDLEDGTESDDILIVFTIKGLLDVNKDHETGGDMPINAV
ncbi:MAG: hypothetical protein LQ344_002356 [Seirophora lacunosa]|nr:MAG: hypothetical protein LQ344_002356 [Seirophora lacunosa]